MTLGHVRDNFPRITLSLPGRNGPLSVEFIVDTGFDGELALPSALIGQLDASYSTERFVLLAANSPRRRPFYEVVLDGNGEPRVTDVMALDGNPLLGVELLSGNLLQIEMTDGGEVLLEPL
jgi:clan AA aspartic protease